MQPSVTPIFHKPTSTWSYVVADPVSREAAVIDPVLDYDWRSARTGSASADEEACVCDLIAPLGLSQPTVSHHLKVLTSAGFLTRSKRGTWAYFALVPRATERIPTLLAAP